MNIQKFSAALMVTGLLIAAGPAGVVPAMAQSAVPEKQKTQDGADSAFGHYDDAKLKQKTQDGPDSAFGHYDDPKYGHYDDPQYKQRTQALMPTPSTAATK